MILNALAGSPMRPFLCGFPNDVFDMLDAANVVVVDVDVVDVGELAIKLLLLLLLPSESTEDESRMPSFSKNDLAKPAIFSSAAGPFSLTRSLILASAAALIVPALAAFVACQTSWLRIPAGSMGLSETGGESLFFCEQTHNNNPR